MLKKELDAWIERRIGGKLMQIGTTLSPGDAVYSISYDPRHGEWQVDADMIDRVVIWWDGGSVAEPLYAVDYFIMAAGVPARAYDPTFQEDELDIPGFRWWSTEKGARAEIQRLKGEEKANASK